MPTSVCILTRRLCTIPANGFDTMVNGPSHIEKPLARELRSRAEKICRLGKWQLGKSLGAGATAAAYEVQVNGELRALKIYSPKFLKGKSGELVQRRLQLVLNTLARHDCPHLVKIYEGGDAEGIAYLLMERAPGHCLGDVLKLVPPSSIRDIVTQIASAAKSLEEKNLCHRDIKVDNVAISEDFKRATLLDLGVMRWLDEETGAGTDHDGQLPFVATARYSSPEYMFRLVKPGTELWRGLTFYQLGGLLHDLIMKERLFEDVIRQSAENRYLIAHAVATRVPTIKHEASIPIDLVLLAQRALEKDLSRRLALVDWPNFLDQNERYRSEIILGLRTDRTVVQAPSISPVHKWTRDLEILTNRLLSEAGIHCRHRSTVDENSHGIIELTWSPATMAIPVGAEVCVRFSLTWRDGLLAIDGDAVLKAAGEIRSSIDSAPVISFSADNNDELQATLIDHLQDSFLNISAKVVENHLNRSPSEAVK